MPLTNKPAVTKFQVGQTRTYIKERRAITAVITKIESQVNNPLNDSTGKQNNTYYFANEPSSIPEVDVFATSNLALKKLKGGYILDLSGTDFGANDMSNKDLSGCNLSNCDFSAVTGLAFMNVSGSNLTDATMHDDYDTKAEFMNEVGSGAFDDDTIWTDGTKITL